MWSWQRAHWTVRAMVERMTTSMRSSMMSWVTPMKRRPPVRKPMAARSGEAGGRSWSPAIWRRRKRL